MVEHIKKELDFGERLAQLAEEAAELAQAALKLRRAYDGLNPTPKSFTECVEDLVGEIADVRVCLRVLDSEDPLGVEDLMKAKIARWYNRLNEKNQQTSEAPHGKEPTADGTD